MMFYCLFLLVDIRAYCIKLHPDWKFRFCRIIILPRFLMVFAWILKLSQEKVFFWYISVYEDPSSPHVLYHVPILCYTMIRVDYNPNCNHNALYDTVFFFRKSFKSRNPPFCFEKVENSLHAKLNNYQKA